MIMITDMGLVHHGVSVYAPSFRWCSLRLSLEGWPGWVDLGSWLHEMVYSSGPVHWI